MKLFLASENSLLRLPPPSYFPKFCSMTRMSVCIGIPVISEICSAVFFALISGDATISSILIFLSAFMRSPSSIACLCPNSVSSISVAPQTFPSTFHIVCPCLVKYNFDMIYPFVFKASFSSFIYCHIYINSLTNSL